MHPFPVSLVGQDIRLSSGRPGFKSRTGNPYFAAPSPDHKNQNHGHGGARTHDPGLIRPMLYHLSYATLRSAKARLQGLRAAKCSRRGSNPGPPAHKTGALPTAPRERGLLIAAPRCGRLPPPGLGRPKKVLDPGIEPGTYCVLGSRHNQLDQPSLGAYQPWRDSNPQSRDS